LANFYVHSIARPWITALMAKTLALRTRRSASSGGDYMIWPRNLFLAGASVAVALTLQVTAPLAAGIQALRVPADGASPALSGAVWYPCLVAPTEFEIGPFTVSAAKDCPMADRNLPLVVMSHGRVDSFLGNRDTAQALADAGFVVATISHPGDSTQDTSRSNELSVYFDRPADIKRLIDYLTGAWSSASSIDPQRIGIFGFSRGGYTGLVLAGAIPGFRQDSPLCKGRTDELCAELREGRLRRPVRDSRIKAAVIVDPLGIFFGRDSFENVHVPIQLWRSEYGGDGVTPDRVAFIAEALPVKPDFRSVENAGHFSFLPPCPDAILQTAREICADAGGFDRKAFHRTFNTQVIDFFRRSLR
jgi:predicted dienelactone hydrolase